MSHHKFEGLVEGTAWNEVWPEQQPPGLNHLSARDYALERLFDYLATVTWRHTGRTRDSEPVEFQIQRCRMFVEQPEADITLAFPAIAVLPNNNAPEAEWLGPPVLIDDGRQGIEPATYEGFGDHTVLVQTAELSEEVILDMWFETRAQRRAVQAGLETSVLNTQAGPLYLTLPDYYDRIAVFTFKGSRRFDGDFAVKNRRELQVTLNLRVECVFPVLMRDFDPHFVVETE